MAGVAEVEPEAARLEEDATAFVIVEGCLKSGMNEKSQRYKDGVSKKQAEGKERSEKK